MTNPWDWPSYYLLITFASRGKGAGSVLVDHQHQHTVMEFIQSKWGSLRFDRFDVQPLTDESFQAMVDEYSEVNMLVD